MKKCLNCQNPLKENDHYCRKCGIKVQKNNYYILINVLIILSLVSIIILLALIINYIIYK